MTTIIAMFSWIPAPFNAIIIAAFGVFALVALAKLVKLILDVLPFV